MTPQREPSPRPPAHEQPRFGRRGATHHPSGGVAARVARELTRQLYRERYGDIQRWRC